MVVDDGKGRLKKAPIEAAEKKVLGERLDNMEKRRRIKPGMGATIESSIVRGKKV